MLWEKLNSAALEWHSKQLFLQDQESEILTTRGSSLSSDPEDSDEAHWSLWEDIDLTVWAFSYEWSRAQWMFRGKSLVKCQCRWLELCQKALELRTDVRTMLSKQTIERQNYNQDLSLVIATAWFFIR